MNDYVKFLTQQFVAYVDSPQEERRAAKNERNSVKLPLHFRWFGMLPLAVSIFLKKKAIKKQ